MTDPVQLKKLFFYQLSKSSVKTVSELFKSAVLTFCATGYPCSFFSFPAKSGASDSHQNESNDIQLKTILSRNLNNIRSSV